MSAAMNITTVLNDEQQRQNQQAIGRGGLLPTSVRNITGYPSPAEPSQPAPMWQGQYQHPPPFDGMYLNRRNSNGRPLPTSLRVDTHITQPAPVDDSRKYPCGTCGKNFARRSDLARHERIHSNHRPHLCPEPNCNKQFIQRSALTVHLRVHTGEKPHLCERCGKPFSDSSSLARHRRIHSGRRPYQCPYADCQKTFTRRTTLTRHQNHHTGTVEEAAAATARALAARGPDHRRRSSGSTNTSGIVSGVSSPSPSGHTFPLSPMPDLPQIPSLERTSVPPYSDLLPAHVRPSLQQPSPRSSPGANSPSPYLDGGLSRPSLTSHPQLPVLEPPPLYHEMRSGSGSPHLSGTPTGWQSPVSHSMPSPMGSDSMGHYDQHHHPPPSMPLYLPSSHARRPSSMEPDHLDLNRPRALHTPPGSLWNGSMG